MPSVEDSARRQAFGPLAFDMGLVALLSFAIIQARAFPTQQARFFPLAIGVPVLLLSVAQLLADLVRVFRAANNARLVRQIMDLSFESELSPKEVAVGSATAFGWIFGFWLVTYAVGLSIATVVFVPSYLLVQAKTVWSNALLGGLVIWVIIWWVFGEVLGIPAPRGLMRW